MTLSRLTKELKGQGLDKILAKLYGENDLRVNKQRYLDLLQGGESVTTENSPSPPFFVSVPGRTELGGNHTDHNHGRVLAASVNRDCVGLIIPTTDQTISIHSTAIDRDIHVDLSHLSPHEEEKGRPEALVRGVCATWSSTHHLKYGFAGFLDNTIPVGGGLSSSAAFGVLLGAALSQANDVEINRTELAHFAREAENSYFGKPCGLMDQLSCSLGGLLAIDFKNPSTPLTQQIDIDLTRFGYQLLLIDTGSSHAELTAHYAAIPEEMKLVTDQLHVQWGRELTLDQLLTALPDIRKITGDRPILRMMHFLTEDQRAANQAELLRQGKFDDFLELVRQSGDSSWRLLQNCQTGDASDQPVALGIVLSQTLCPQAVARIHGGGFAGTIQVWVPDDDYDGFRSEIERLFGKDAVLAVRTGRPGATILGGRK